MKMINRKTKIKDAISEIKIKKYKTTDLLTNEMVSVKVSKYIKTINK